MRIRHQTQNAPAMGRSACSPILTAICGSFRRSRGDAPAGSDTAVHCQNYFGGPQQFTTGATALTSIPGMTNSGIVLAGLCSWARGLHDDLAGEGVYVGHLSIGVPIVPGSGEGDPDALADRWYRLAQAGGTFETTVGI